MSVDMKDRAANEQRPEQHYTYAAAGEILMLAADTVRKKAAQGLIRVQRYGPKTVRIPQSEIIRIQRNGW